MCSMHVNAKLLILFKLLRFSALFLWKKIKIKIHVFFLVAAVGKDSLSFFYHKEKAKNGDQQVAITVH